MSGGATPRYVKTTQTLTVKARTYFYGQGMPDADDQLPSVFADDKLEYERLFALSTQRTSSSRSYRFDKYISIFQI